MMNTKPKTGHICHISIPTPRVHSDEGTERTKELEYGGELHEMLLPDTTSPWQRQQQWTPAEDLTTEENKYMSKISF